MHASRSSLLALRLVATVGIVACGEQRAPLAPADHGVRAGVASLPAPGGRRLLVFGAQQLPADFASRVTSLGGTVESALDSIGVAIVTGLGDSAAALLAAQPDVKSVEPDPVTSLRDATEDSDTSTDALSDVFAAADATASPATAPFYPRQWNMRAVFADQAWAAGFMGSREVRVAILDTGIDYLHPDLVGLVDLQRSKSFVPEEDAAVAVRFPGRLPFTDLFWHGTAVASVIATNATVLAGMNRAVSLIAVKIADSTDFGSYGRMLTGIVYAADQGVDVINISRGHERAKSESPGFVAAFERAVDYAFRKGALLVSVPFNDGADLDHNGDLVRMPCEAANAICVAATGPTGATSVNGPWVNVDASAPYTAFGRSAISVAAPGGAGDPGQFRRVWVLCTGTWTQGTVPPACRTNSVPLTRRIAQGAGVSFAAPHVAGLAALLVAQLGHGNPALIRERILQTADDVGDPGDDPRYGRGRINVARALGVIP